MKKLRLPGAVLEAIVKEIPKKINYKTPRFNSLWSSAMFQPPESRWIWVAISSFVNEIVSHPPKEEWEWKVVSILTTKSVDELKKEESERTEKNDRQKKTN